MAEKKNKKEQEGVNVTNTGMFKVLSDVEWWKKYKKKHNLGNQAVAKRMLLVANRLIAFDSREEAEIVYYKSLNTDIWQDAHDKYPNSNSEEALEATKYIVKEMGKKYSKDYSEDEWFLMEGDLRSQVHAGLT